MRDIALADKPLEQDLLPPRRMRRVPPAAGLAGKPQEEVRRGPGGGKALQHSVAKLGVARQQDRQAAPPHRIGGELRHLRDEGGACLRNQPEDRGELRPGFVGAACAQILIEEQQPRHSFSRIAAARLYEQGFAPRLLLVGRRGKGGDQEGLVGERRLVERMQRTVAVGRADLPVSQADLQERHLDCRHGIIGRDCEGRRRVGAGEGIHRRDPEGPPADERRQRNGDREADQPAAGPTAGGASPFTPHAAQ